MDAFTSMSSVDSFEKYVQNRQFRRKRNMCAGKEIPANYVVN